MGYVLTEDGNEMRMCQKNDEKPLVADCLLPVRAVSTSAVGAIRQNAQRR